MLDNHGVELLPGLPDATEYIDTAEWLDMVPLHDTELGKAVEGIKIDEAVVRLTQVSLSPPSPGSCAVG